MTDQPAQPASHSAELPGLPEIPGGWSPREITLGGRQFELVLPANPDAFLDDETIQAEHSRNGFFPWWPYLWPSSMKLAECILRHDWTSRPTVLELGAGLGLSGLAAAACGLPVTFSDFRQLPVDLAVCNAQRNGCRNVSGQLIDWREPPRAAYELALASDVLYEEGNLPLVLDALEAVLAPRGVAWVGEPGRRPAEAFAALAEQRGWSVELLDASWQPLPAFQHSGFQIFRLHRGTRNAPAS